MNAKYFQTLAAQLISLLLVFYSLKLAATQFSEKDFGIYNVIRRFLAIINYPLLMGLGISLPIFLAKESERKEEQVSFISTSFYFFFFSFLLVILTNLIFPSFLIRLILGFNNVYLSWIIVIGFGNLYLYSILYSIYRGFQIFFKANIYQLTVTGIIPIISFFLSGNSIYHFFISYLLFFSITNIIVILDFKSHKLISLHLKPSKIKEITYNFLYFGLPRVPGEFALFGLMSFPLFFVAKYDSLQMSGYVAIGFTFVQLVSSFYEFLGTLLLPKSAKMAAENDFFKLNKLINKIVLFSFATSIFISFIIFYKLEFVLNFLGKNRFLTQVNYSRMVLFCIPFYIIYIVLRNPQDAISVKPFNTFNLCICFSLQFIILILSKFAINKMIYYYASILVPFSLLGIFSLIIWKFQIRKNFV